MSCVLADSGSLGGIWRASCATSARHSQPAIRERDRCIQRGTVTPSLPSPKKYKPGTFTYLPQGRTLRIVGVTPEPDLWAGYKYINGTASWHARSGAVKILFDLYSHSPCPSLHTIAHDDGLSPSSNCCPNSEPFRLLLDFGETNVRFLGRCATGMISGLFSPLFCFPPLSEGINALGPLRHFTPVRASWSAMWDTSTAVVSICFLQAARQDPFDWVKIFWKPSNHWKLVPRGLPQWI